MRTAPCLHLVLAAAIAYPVVAPGATANQLPEVTDIPSGPMRFDPGPKEAIENRGGYSPRVSLEILPARLDLVPDISLVYSHAHANGYLGAGWRLAFESVIERRSALRGVAHFEDDDLFLLDGVELVETGDGTWRRLHDDRTIITPIRDLSATGPVARTMVESQLAGEIVGWRTRKDGLVMTYGRGSAVVPAPDSDDSAILRRGDDAAIGSGQATGWLLTRIEDAFGNRIVVTYTVPTWGGDIGAPGQVDPLIERPTTVAARDHGGHSPPTPRAARTAGRMATTPQTLGEPTRRPLPSAIVYNQQGDDEHRIEFRYRNRDDIRVSYADGTPRVEAKLLDEVLVKSVRSGVEALAYHYELTYRQAVHDVQSLLTSVRRVPVEADGEDGGESFALRSFTYQDEAFPGWGEAQDLVPLGADLFSEPADTDDLEAHTRIADVDADGRPDLLVFNEVCSPQDMPGPDLGSIITCRDANHRVFLNRRAEPPDLGDPVPRSTGARIAAPGTTPLPAGRVHFEYDAGRSAALTDFLGPVHSHITGERVEFRLVDLDRDGHLDLARGTGGGSEIGSGATPHYQQILLGDRDGWDVADAEPVDWLTDNILVNYRFADLNGDGFVDLIAQDRALLNSGRFPFFDIDEAVELDDPLTSARHFGSDDADCVQSDDGTLLLEESLGAWYLNDSRVYFPVPDEALNLRMSLDEWVWRNTLDADFNGDGMLDRLISVPWLLEEGDVWVVDTQRCGSHIALYLGDGQGGFHEAGYGTGNLSAVNLASTSHEVQVNETGPEERVTWTHRLHHLAVADMDRSGRPEITQQCPETPPWAGLAVLKDQGIANGAGYGHDGAVACSSLSIATPPLPVFGLMPLREVSSSLLDVDADGMPDGYIGPAHPADPPDMSSAVELDVDNPLPRWYRNLATVPQNRLLTIKGPFGGVTRLAWAMSGEHGESLPLNLDLIASVDGEDGKTEYAFADGVYDDNRFLGFRRVEIRDAAGGTVVRSYHGTKEFEGKPLTAQIFDAAGQLVQLRQFLYGIHPPPDVFTDGEPIPPGWIVPDLTPPYFNPVARVCDFELRATSEAVDVDDLMALCDDFEDEWDTDVFQPGTELGLPVAADALPWLSRRVLDRDVWAVLRGAEPGAVAGEDARVEQLEWLQARLGESPDIAAFVGTVPRSAARRPLSGELAAAAPGSTGRPGAGRRGSAIAVTPEPQAKTSIVAGYRFYVRETDHDLASGMPTEVRNWRDVRTRADSTVSTMTYEPLDTALAFAALATSETRDRDGVLFESYRYEDYVGTAWQRQHQLTPGIAKPAAQRLAPVDRDLLLVVGRTRTRIVDPDTGLLREQAGWGGYAPVRYRHDACGQVRRETNVLGHWSETERDAACRETAVTTSAGLETRFRYDGHGGLLSSSTRAEPSPAEVVEHAWVYGTAAVGDAPYHVEIRPRSDGGRDLVRSFIDAHGRETLQERCPEGTPGSLDCDPAADRISIVTRYAAETGELVFASEPFGRDASADDRATTFAYDEFRRKIGQTLPDGGEIAFEFGLGYHKRIDPLGLETRMEQSTTRRELTVEGVFRGSEKYNAFGQVVSAVDAAGGVTTYTYDRYNRLATRRDPAVDLLESCNGDSATPTVEAEPLWTYGYSLADEEISLTDPRGNTVRREHDEIGRLLELTGPDGEVIERRRYVDGRYPQRRQVVEDESGARRTEFRDARDRTVRLVDADGAETRTEFDLRGHPYRLTLPWGEILERDYDFRDLVVGHTARRGAGDAVTVFERDAAGRVIATVDPDGVRTARSYDALGRVTRVALGEPGLELEAYTYDLAGRPTLAVVNGAVTRREYDALGRVTAEHLGYEKGSRPDSLVEIRRSWTALDQLASETNGEGQLRRFAYDAAGRLRSTEYVEADGLVIGTEEVDYDAVGNPTRLRDGRGIAVCNDFDGRNRLVSTTPDGLGTTTFAYQAGAAHPVTGRATESLRTTTQAPTGELRSRWTDGRGRDWLTQLEDGTVRAEIFVNGLLGRSIRFDRDGRLHAAKLYDYEPASSHLVAEYDWMKARPARACRADPSRCPGSVTRFRLTPGDRIQAIIDAAGNETRYGYAFRDGTGLLETVDYGGALRTEQRYHPTYPLIVEMLAGPKDALIRSRFERERNVRLSRVLRLRDSDGSLEILGFDYDGAGRRSRADFLRDRVPQGGYSQAYDARGQLLSRSYDIAGLDHSLTIEWRYAPDGQLASVLYPSGRRVDYTYDSDSTGLASISLDTGAAVAAADVRDAAGRLTGVTIAPGARHEVRMRRQFGSLGREEERSISGVHGDGDVLTERYAYDAAGHLTSVTVQAGSVPLSEHRYRYDERDYLVGEQHTGVGLDLRRRFDYDAAGRRIASLSMDHGSAEPVTFEYGPGNRLTRVGSAGLDWDAWGRLLRDQDGRKLEWGLASQLIAVSGSGGAREAQGHDADGQRVWRENGPGREFYVPGPRAGSVLHHRDADGGSEDLVHLPDGRLAAIVRTTTDGEVEVRPVVSGLTGSPDRIGGIAQAHRHVVRSAFGEVLAVDGELDSQLGFHEMWENDEDGLMTAGVRPYSAGVDRFLAPDPLAFAAAADPNDAADLYRYAHNNPLLLRDPSGFRGELVPDSGNRSGDYEESARQRILRTLEPRYIEGMGGGPAHIGGAVRQCQACGPTVAEMIVARKVENALDDFSKAVGVAVEEIVAAIDDRGQIRVGVDMTPEQVAQIVAFLHWAAQNGFVTAAGATGRSAAPEDILSLTALQTDLRRAERRQERQQAQEERRQNRGFGRAAASDSFAEFPIGYDANGDGLAEAPVDERPEGWREGEAWQYYPTPLPGARRLTDDVKEQAHELEQQFRGEGGELEAPQQRWWPWISGQVKGLPYGTVHLGFSLGGGFGGGYLSGGGIRKDISCATCPWDFLHGWGVYATQSQITGPYAGIGAEINAGYCQGSSFYGQSVGQGASGVFGVSWIPAWNSPGILGSPVRGYTFGVGPSEGFGWFMHQTTTY